MKKFLSLVLLLMFVFVLAACDGEITLPTDVTVPTTGETTTEAVTTGDMTTEVTTEAPTTGETTTTTEEVTTVEQTTADTTPPVLSGVDDVEVFIGVDFNPLDGVTAIDNVDGDITDDIVVNGLVNTDSTGTYFLKYISEDAAGNRSEATRYVTVIIDPNNLGDEMIQNGDFSLGAGVWSMASGIEGGVGQFTVTQEGDNSVGTINVETAGWSDPFPRLDSNVTDLENGLTYQVSFMAKADAPRPIKVQVGELLPTGPWFVDYMVGQTVIFDLTTEWQTFTFKFTMNQAFDEGTMLPGQLLFNHGGTIEGEVAVDAANYNTVVYYDDVFIEESTADPDTEAPVITAVDVTLESGSDFDPLAGVTAVDVVDGTIELDASHYVSDVDTSTPGEYTVTYTVADEAGNEASLSITVTVVEVIFNDTGEVIDGSFVSTTEIVAEVQDTEENGFADITDPEIWYQYTAGWDGAEATFSIVDETAVIDITTAGGAFWGLQLKQKGLHLVQGETYKISFTASASADRDIIVELLDASQSFNLTSTATSFSMIFTYDGEEVSNAVIGFMLGNTENFAAGVVTIDDVMLSVLEQPTLVENSSFDETGWNVWSQDWDGGSGIPAVTYGVNNGAFEVTTDLLGDANWAIQLFQEGLVLENGVTYRVTFDAMADTTREINVKIIDGDGAESFTTLTLTASLANYTYEFTYDGSSTEGKLDFELGLIGTSVAGTVTFDNIMFEKVESDAIVPDTDQLVNGTFEEVVGWGVYSHDSGSTISQVDGELVVSVANTGANNYDVQVFQNDIQLIEGAAYTIVFTAKADAARDIIYKIMTPGYNVRTEETVPLTTEMQTFMYSFVYDGTDPLGQINFELGAVNSAVAGTVTFGKVVFYRTFNVVETEEPEEPVEELLENWIPYGSYSIEYILTYGAVPASWWNSNLQGGFTGFDATNTTFDITFVGENGQDYLFKVEGGGSAAEQAITADGTEQTVSIDLSALTEEERAGLNLMVIFAQTLDATGTLTIMPIADLAVEWIAYGDMTFTYGVTYGVVPAAWWDSNLQTEGVMIPAEAEAVEFTFTGVDTQDYLFKVEGGGSAVEQAITADGTEQTVSIDLSALTPEQREGLNLFVIFAQTEGEEGTLLIHSWKPVVPETADEAWIAYGDFTLVEDGTDKVVTYGVVPSTWWDSNLQTEGIVFDGTDTAVEFTFTGVAGQTYLFKFEGGGAAAEVGAVATGDVQTVLLDLSSLTETQRAGLNLFVFFAQSVGEEGTFTIHSWAPAQVAAGPTQLSAPFGVVVNTDNMVWGAMPEASGFEVYIDGVAGSPFNVPAETYAFDLAALNLDAGTYTITLKALGDGVDTSDSEMTGDFEYTVSSGPTQLSAPFGVVVNTTNIVWGAMPEASGFEVYIDGVTGSPFSVPAETYAFDLAALSLDPGTYTITLKALGDGVDTLDSELTVEYTYTVE